MEIPLYPEEAPPVSDVQGRDGHPGRPRGADARDPALLEFKTEKRRGPSISLGITEIREVARRTISPKVRREKKREPLMPKEEINILKMRRKDSVVSLSKAAEWIRSSQLQLPPPTPAGAISHVPRPYPRRVPVIVAAADPSDRPNYFRVFTEMKTVELEEGAAGHRLAKLLPHRYTKKVPLYGTSPRVLMMMQKGPPTRHTPFENPIPAPVQSYRKRPSALLRSIRPARGSTPPARTVRPKRTTPPPQSELPLHNSKPSAAKRKPSHVPSSQSQPQQPSSTKTKHKAASKIPATLPTEATSTTPPPPPPRIPTPEPPPPRPLDTADVLAQPGGLTGWDTESPIPPTAPLTSATTSHQQPTTLHQPSPTLPTTTAIAAPNPTTAPAPKPYKTRRPTPPKKVAVNLASVLNRRSVSSPPAPSSAPPTQPPAALQDRQGDGKKGDEEGEEKEGVAPLAATPRGKFAGMGRGKGGSQGDQTETEVQRRRSEAINRARKSVLGPSVQIDLTTLRRKRMAEGGAHRAGLEGEKAKDDFLSSLISDMNVLDESSKARYLALSAPLFKDKDVLTMAEMADGLRRTSGKEVAEEEVEFIKRVFELVAGDFVDQAEFCVIAALAERMTLLDTSVRLSFYDTDFKKLEKNIKQYRNLFKTYTQEDGVMTTDDLNILLLSTGLPASSSEAIAQMMNLPSPSQPTPSPDTKQGVGFLDFLSYVPFFTVLHENIVENPFGNDEENGESKRDKLIEALRKGKAAGKEEAKEQGKRGPG
ncbi:hypothetical protein HK104_004980 [Borealophlyctis nickersoniae]|nr:hypothetical protein HK104_004980 [Borealophlyctis nickersoniae]